MGKGLDETNDLDDIKEIKKVTQRIHKFLKKQNKKYKNTLIQDYPLKLDYSKCGNGDLGPAHGISMPQELQEFYGPMF